MAATYSEMSLFSKAAIASYDHDPGASSAVVVSGDGGTTKNYVDMRDFNNFALIVFNSVSTSSSGPTLVEIIAAEDTSGTNATAIKTSGTVASTHVGDYVCLEVNAEQIKEVGVANGYNLRYVTGRITCSNSGDECVATFIRSQCRFPRTGLTANSIQ